MKFAVQTYTLCDGFVNCWSIDEQPHLFDTRAEAEKELAEHPADIQSEIDTGEREADEGYDPDDFMIVEVEV